MPAVLKNLDVCFYISVGPDCISHRILQKNFFCCICGSGVFQSHGSC